MEVIIKSITFRQGTIHDTQTALRIFEETGMDLEKRMCVMAIPDGDDPEVMEKLMKTIHSLLKHLALTSTHFYIAERDEQAIGYSRSIQRDDIQELTEFFVVPREQSAGIGQELLRRSFSEKGARHRTILASLDERALIRYLKTGVYGRFPIKYFSREPESVEVETDLEIEEMRLTGEIQEGINSVDQSIIDHIREEDHQWLIKDRKGYVYRRRGEIVGYGYVGSSSGPFALLRAEDYPAVLGHAESVAYGEWKKFGIWLPLINQRAIEYLLSRRYRMGGFTIIFMSDDKFGRFENYVIFNPPFFI